MEFEARRGMELLKAVREEKGKQKIIVMPRVMAAAVRHPCSRFWVSEERAAVVVSQCLRFGTDRALSGMRQSKRDMFLEIFRRCSALMEQDPRLSVASAAFEAVNSPSPCFYLEPGTARSLLYKYLKQIKSQNG